MFKKGPTPVEVLLSLAEMLLVLIVFGVIAILTIPPAHGVDNELQPAETPSVSVFSQVMPIYLVEETIYFDNYYRKFYHESK